MMLRMEQIIGGVQLKKWCLRLRRLHGDGYAPDEVRHDKVPNLIGFKEIGCYSWLCIWCQDGLFLKVSIHCRRSYNQYTCIYYLFKCCFLWQNKTCFSDCSTKWNQHHGLVWLIEPSQNAYLAKCQVPWKDLVQRWKGMQWKCWKSLYCCSSPLKFEICR
jgi:hypothetical protein